MVSRYGPGRLSGAPSSGMNRECVPPRRTVRSSAPQNNPTTSGCSAMPRMPTTAWGVSIMAMTCRPSSSFGMSVYTLGTITREYGVERTISTSSLNPGSSGPHTRTITRDGSSDAWAMLLRATSRSASPAPSSRSRITMSAIAAAFGKMSGRFAGANKIAGPTIKSSGRERCMALLPSHPHYPWKSSDASINHLYRSS